MSKVASAQQDKLREERKNHRQTVLIEYLTGIAQGNIHIAKEIAKKYGIGRSQVYNLINQAERDV